MYIATQPQCYLNFIGLSAKTCGTNPSVSGLYLDQLEGLSTRTTAQVVGPAHNTAAELVRENLALVLSNYEMQLQSELASLGWFLPMMPLHTREYGDLNASELLAAAPLERGLKIVRYASTQPLAGIYIRSVTIRAVHSGPVTLLFKDKAGATVYSLPVVLSDQYATLVNVERLFSQDVLYIALDNTNFQTYSSKTCNSVCSYKNSLWRGNYMGYCVSGWDGSSECSEAYGLGADVGLACSISELMCKVLPYAKQAILYALGAQILAEMQASERLNYFAVASKEWAAEKAVEWQSRADLFFAQAVRTLIPSLGQMDQKCITCQRQGKPRLMGLV